LVATTHAAYKAAVNQVVEHRHLFRQAQHVPDWHHYDARGNLQLAGPLTDVQGLHQGSRRVAVVGEVVFRDEAVLEPHFLGILNLFHPFFEEGRPVAQVRVRPFVKEAKLHERILLVGWLNIAGQFNDLLCWQSTWLAVIP